MRQHMLILACTLQLTVAAVLLRKSHPHDDTTVDDLQEEEEFHKNYTSDENGVHPKKQETAPKSSESKAPHDPHPDAVHEDHSHVGEDHEHGGSPGSGRGRMVPRTHVKGPEANGEHEPFHWSYHKPDLWGDHFEKCKGHAQSPINIETGNVVTSGSDNQKLAPLMKYHPLDYRSVMNHGHNVQVNGEFGTLELPDGLYNIHQFHFHFPSEHEINGKLAAGEIHIVHQKDGSHGTDDLAVVGILLEEGIEKDDNKKQLAFLKNLGFGSTLPADGTEKPLTDSVDLSAFAKQFAGDFYHYEGSLTTPPCSQTVHWYVLHDPAVVTADMVANFKTHYPQPHNNRPVTPLHGRKVVFSKVSTGPDEFKSAPAKSASMHLHVSMGLLLVAATVTLVSQAL